MNRQLQPERIGKDNHRIDATGSQGKGKGKMGWGGKRGAEGTGGSRAEAIKKNRRGSGDLHYLK